MLVAEWTSLDEDLSAGYGCVSCVGEEHVLAAQLLRSGNIRAEVQSNSHVLDIRFQSLRSGIRGQLQVHFFPVGRGTVIGYVHGVAHVRVSYA